MTLTNPNAMHGGVTAASPPGGRPRASDAPDSPFARWLAGQTRTVPEIATELKVSRWAIYNLRSGYYRPSLEMATKIAELSRPRDAAGEPIGDPAVPMDTWPEPKPRTTRRKRKPAPRRDFRRQAKRRAAKATQG